MKRVSWLAAALVVAVACRDATTSPVSNGGAAQFAGPPRAVLAEPCPSGPFGPGLSIVTPLTGVATATGDGAPVTTGTVAGPGSSIEYCALGMTWAFALTVNGGTPINGYGTVNIAGDVVTIASTDFGWTIVFAPAPPPPPPTNNPTAKNQCMKNGWVAFGFKNQGQCVRFVETGKDSR